MKAKGGRTHRHPRREGGKLKNHKHPHGRLEIPQVRKDIELRLEREIELTAGEYVRGGNHKKGKIHHIETGEFRRNPRGLFGNSHGRGG